MPVPLDSWQERMERHFGALSAQRAASGVPLFALEHGLSAVQIDEVAVLLRQRVLSGQRLTPHWLLWTMYAAERGYTYEGDEYWQSFEETTPGWIAIPRSRYLISSWFRRFQSSYNGVVPSGPWANHFSIIAWPITHAILPRYLQRQFARTLYELRFHLARLRSIEPGTIGRLIAANVYSSSTRLEEFLQQEELVGRIVLALLHPDQKEREEPLLPHTLARIVGDLESVRDARGWIKETSRVVSDRFVGLGRGSAPRQPQAGRGTPGSPALQPDVRPDLRLHYKGSGVWDLQIDIPSFRDIAGLNPDVQQFLRQTRCTLNGSSGKKPPGWLISGRRQAVLRQWPDPERPLVEFEKSNGTVDHLLKSECRMSAGPIWLFRVGRDGLAREIAGRIVRPGQDYILASRDPLKDLPGKAETCTINCAGVNAAYLKLPEALSEALMRQLRSLKLEVARTIRVWPAGFPGRGWDGEGRGEWLTTEKPCLGVLADHEVEEFHVSLNGSAPRTIHPRAPGQPTFVQLPPLTVGRHVLTFRAQSKSAFSEGTSPHEGYLELRVREPDAWMPGIASHAGLVVHRNPNDAGLDAFWHNDFELSVVGPPGRQITPHVSLQNAREEEIYGRQVCPPLDLPLEPAVWKRRFADFVRREKCEWRYLEAATGVLSLDGGDLGKYLIRFEHEVLPVRWVLQHSECGVTVRLIDDTNQENAEKKFLFMSMEQPRIIQRINNEHALTARYVESPGGLFIAKIGKYRDAVVVSTGLTGGGLIGLGVQPNLGHVSNDPAQIIKLLRVLRSWCRARLAGYLAEARRRQVADTLIDGLIGTLAGWDWARAETQFRDPSRSAVALLRLKSLVDQRSGFGSVLARDAPSTDDDPKAFLSWFSEISKRYHICSDDALNKFAIDFAKRPERLTAIYLDQLPYYLDRAMKNQPLLRGARLAVLARRAALTHSPGHTQEAGT